MAIIRQANLLPQQRVDVPHLRAIESSICNDFDVLAGKIISGEKALVVKGFTIPTTGTVGVAADSLQLNVASSVLLHKNGSEAGTIYAASNSEPVQVLSATNTKVSGTFTAGVTNYVGLDLIRASDSATADLVQFLNADTKKETGQTVPLARTLQYKIIISTQNFNSASNVLPIAKVVTDANNLVVSIQDARPMLFRLGSGGDNASGISSYLWSTRKENNILYTGGNDPFSGEDKSISSLKSWMDAIMTSVWETKGGERWYSPQNRDSVKALYGPVATLADNWVFSGSTIKWEAISLAFENASTAGVFKNTIADNTAGLTINDGQCVYVDLVRESNATGVQAYITNLTDLGSSNIPGRRVILAWRVGSNVYARDRAYEIGRALQVASTTVLGVVKLSRAASTPAAPIVISDTGGTIAATASNVGLTVTGGSAAGDAIVATGGTDGRAVVALGVGMGEAINAQGGNSAGPGVVGRGGTSSGIGVYGYGGGPNGIGVRGIGIGSGAGVYASGASGTVGVWADSSATNVNVIKADGYIDLSGGAQPTAATGFSNQLTKKNLCKAWANVSLNNSANPALNNGFNIGSLTGAISGQILTIPFVTAMAAQPYSVTITVSDDIGTTMVHPRVITAATGAVTIRLRDSAGAIVDPAGGSTNGLKIFVQVFAEQ